MPKSQWRNIAKFSLLCDRNWVLWGKFWTNNHGGCQSSVDLYRSMTSAANHCLLTAYGLELLSQEASHGAAVAKDDTTAEGRARADVTLPLASLWILDDQ